MAKHHMTHAEEVKGGEHSHKKKKEHKMKKTAHKAKVAKKKHHEK